MIILQLLHFYNSTLAVVLLCLSFSVYQRRKSLNLIKAQVERKMKKKWKFEQ